MSEVSQSYTPAWKLTQLIKDEGLTSYKLEIHLAGKVSKSTIYRYSHATPDSVNLEIVGWILWALEDLTGKTFSLTDILRYEKSSR